MRILSSCICAAFLLAAPTSGSAQGASVPTQEQLQRASAAFQAGYAAVAGGDLVKARADFEVAVQLAPQVEEGHSALGAVLYRLQAYPLAIDELGKALSLKPDDQAALANLAMSYTDSGDFTRALRTFELLSDHGTALAPDLLAGYARAEAAAGRYPEAVAHMQAAVAAAPKDALLYDQLGTLYAQQHSWALAESSYQQAIQADPSLAVAHLHLGVAIESAADASRLPLAIAELTRAAELAPQSALAQLELGNALAAAGRDDEAIPHLDQAQKLDTSGVGAADQLAMVLQRTGEVQQAIPLFEKVVAAQPQNTVALSNLALALVQTGKAKEAIAYLQRVLTIQPGDPGAEQILGVAYLQQSDVDDAMAQFKAALAATPDNPQLHYNLGLALKLKDDLPDAVKELEEAARLDPQSPDAPYTLGILYMQLGRFDDAVKNLTQSLDRRPANGDAWAILGSVYRQEGKTQEAMNALRKAIELLPNQPGPHITLASVLQEAGQKDEAAAERKKAAELTRIATNRQRAQFATNAANAYLEKGQVADAVTHYQEAISSDPTFAEAHRQLAIAYQREGRPSDAASELAAAEKLEGHPK
jgi:tetratricopeptide (TPR) repeat protein